MSARVDAGAAVLERREIRLERDADTLVIHLGGDWRLHDRLLPIEIVEAELASGTFSRIRLEASGLSDWDSSFLVFYRRVRRLAEGRGLELDAEKLPEGARRLVALAEAVPEQTDARRDDRKRPLLARVGERAMSAGSGVTRSIDFFGEVAIGLGGLLRGKARFRRVDLWVLIQQAGAEALPIVGLVSLLFGLILAFVGAVQLEQFGATIYVADLVGVAAVRDMGALITAIVMAGRSGAAYAAQLASMKVSQEIDALTTMGISPIEYLVAPRILALMIMMPLLTLYSDFLTILGGGATAVSLMNVTANAYVQQTMNAIDVTDVVSGVVKGSVYGLLVAATGCLRGLQAERSSAGVGDAATSAVVTGIVWIIVACGLFQYVSYLLGI